MSHSPEQKRKKEEAMAESKRHTEYNVVGDKTDGKRYGDDEREEHMENGEKMRGM